MPFDAGTAQGKLDLDAKGFNQALESSKRGVGSFVASTSKMVLGLGGIATGLTAAVGAILGGAGLVAALKAGSAEAAEDERALVSLTNALRTQGVPNFKAVAEEANSFAGELQRLTGIGDTVILGVVQRLSQLGVESGSLKSATQTVLDFSAAFGVDATKAAQLFGQSLQGNAGKLARFIPEIKNLTKAQLEAGAAFRVASVAVEGQAAALGDTFSNRISRLSQSFTDLLAVFGKGFNAAFGPLATEIQGVIDNITDRLSSGEGFARITAAAQTAATTVKTIFLTLIEAAPGVLQAFVNIADGVVTAFDAVLGVVQFALVAVGKFEAAEKIEKARASLDGLSGSLEKGAASLEKIKNSVEDTLDPSKSLADNAEEVAKAFGLAAVNAGKTESATRKAEVAVATAKNRAQGLVDIWAKTNDQVDATASSTSKVTSETRAAATAADDLADSWEGAAASAASAASSSDLAARFAASGADSFGRRAGGSTSLDFSDPFQALAQNELASRQLGRARYTAYAGATQINAARQFADGVQAYTQAALDRAFSEYTTQILSELSAAGILDPTTRNRIVRERIAEAQRFGILPPTTEARSFY